MEPNPLGETSVWSPDIIPVGMAFIGSILNAWRVSMVDKVLAIVRKTMLHENRLEGFSFRPQAGEVILALLQTDERSPYPEHDLLLTFSGLKSFHGEGVGESGGADDVLGIECESVAGGYEARITLGDLGGPRWRIRVNFADLRFQRSPQYH